MSKKSSHEASSFCVSLGNCCSVVSVRQENPLQEVVVNDKMK